MATEGAPVYAGMPPEDRWLTPASDPDDIRLAFETVSSRLLEQAANIKVALCGA